MPEKQRHRLLFQMRRSCKKTTLRSIELNMKLETFTEIDLTEELNGAQFVQVCRGLPNTVLVYYNCYHSARTIINSLRNSV